MEIGNGGGIDFLSRNTSLLTGNYPLRLFSLLGRLIVPN